MRYVDTGSRNPTQALGAWLQAELASDIVELRWQSGFFTAGGLGLLAPTLQRLTANNQTIKAVIGSNNGVTFRDHVIQLLEFLGVPRPQAYLGVVSYSNAFFHPKTYHMRRLDGSQCAYVGSANFTEDGVASLHVEAGLILDTRDGDAETVLDQIAAATDAWFTTDRDGFCQITGPETIDWLVTEGVLALIPLPSVSEGTGVGGGSRLGTRPTLQRLIGLPRLPTGRTPRTGEVQTPALPGNICVSRSGFPDYLLFAPNATSPTRGSQALSGSLLPSGAVGLVIRLGSANLRHFGGGGGTADIGLPIASVQTLRFGFYHRTVDRGRAEIDLALRYQGASSTIVLPPTTTNVMTYGYAPEETSHENIRMVVPRREVRTLGEQLRQAGLPVPSEGDVALLEWPVSARPEFRLTFLERGSPLFRLAQSLFEDAATADQLVGQGACWLPPGVAPPW